MYSILYPILVQTSGLSNKRKRRHTAESLQRTTLFKVIREYRTMYICRGRTSYRRSICDIPSGGGTGQITHL